MSEKKNRDSEHREKWGVPLEEVAGRTAGHLVDPPNVTAIELLANIKRGSEVVLAGVASMPDVLDKISQMRDEQASIIMAEKMIISDFEKATSNGISEADLQEWTRWKESMMAPLHKAFKQTRMKLAHQMVSSLFEHVMIETAAVDGKRAEQVVTVNNAMVLQNQNDLAKLFPERKKRSLTNPLGR
jgi:hypothetical protein